MGDWKRAVAKHLRVPTSRLDSADADLVKALSLEIIRLRDVERRAATAENSLKRLRGAWKILKETL